MRRGDGSQTGSRQPSMRQSRREVGRASSRDRVSISVGGDAPEVKAIHERVLQLGITGADVAKIAADGGAPRGWPDGPPCCTARSADAPAAHDDAVALMGSLSRLYISDRLSLAGFERD